MDATSLAKRILQNDEFNPVQIYVSEFLNSKYPGFDFKTWNINTLPSIDKRNELRPDEYKNMRDVLKPYIDDFNLTLKEAIKQVLQAKLESESDTDSNKEELIEDACTIVLAKLESEK